MADPLAEQKIRHQFIDLYRTFVILLMLEGHVVRAFLPPDLQQTRWFQLHEFLHGLSAPAFLFGAGLTFVISTRKRWEEYHHWGPPLARRVRRLVAVLFLGLAIHLPYYSIRKLILDCTNADYLVLFQSDVLVCIGIGLLSLHGIVFFFKSEPKFYALVLAAVIAVSMLTPVVWQRDVYAGVPIPVAQLLNGNNGSFFPLFPYVGFLFAGVLVSWEYLVAVRSGRQSKFMLQLALAGAACIVGGIIFDAIPVRVYREYNFWMTSPNYFLIRVGMLMLLASAMWYVSKFAENLPAYATVMGRESLAVYVAHLLVLYGSAMNPELNLQVQLGLNKSVGESVLIAIGLTAAMFAFAQAWHTLKRDHAKILRIVQLAGSGAFVYFLFTRDF